MPAFARTLGVCLSLSFCFLSGVAVAETPEKPFQISLPAGNLADALDKLGDQSGLQIMYEPALASGIRVAAVNGTLTVRDALTQLLAQTGLQADRVNDKTVVLKRAGAKKEPVKMEQDEPSTANRPSQEPSEKLEEIVVTAQKREERLKDVPISVSVLGGADLDKSTAEGITESLNSVPGVMAQQSYIGGGTQVTVRGVAASSTILHGSSPVAYYVDSVPFGLIKTSVGPDSNAYDMERVEVLRGPQGTLYGASALNGVVRVLTKDADPNNFEFKARTSASATDGGSGNYRGDAALNVPIVEGKLAARAAVGYENKGGWIDRPNEKNANDAQLRSYRLKINAQPTEKLSIGLSGWSSRNDYGAPSMAADNGRYSITANEPMSTNYDAYGLKVGYDFTGFSVASMTSYLDYDNSGVLDLAPLGAPGIPFVNQYFAHVFSEEVILNSQHGESWRWSAGGIYRDAKDRTFQQIPGIFPADVNFNDTSKSFAVFGEVTRLLLDRRLELSAGLRYFKDDVGTNENSSFTGILGAPLIDVSSNFHKTTPRVVLTWHPNDELTTYASYAEGFRSGFQQQPSVITSNPGIPPVNADSLKNYEIGTKGSLFDGRLAFDTAVYYIDWQDVQSDAEVLINGIPVVALTNGKSASGIGFDFAATTEPVHRLKLGATFSWNNLEWDSAVEAGGAILFAKGERLNLSPKYTVGASADYAFPLGSSGYEGGLSVSANYNSDQFIKTTTGFGQADAILIARASVSISAPAHWTASIYGDNLNNERGAIQQAPFSIPDWTVRPRPKTIGLQFEYHV
jgi:iron complex outermembrane receptor protein